MSHSFMNKPKQKDSPLVCYRCGANKKKAKCKQYGNMVWCAKCKAEIENMEPVSLRNTDDVHRPFGFGSLQCKCKKGQPSSDCPIHLQTLRARHQRERLEIHERMKGAPTVWIFDKKKRRGHAA